MIKLRDDAVFGSVSKKKIILLDECHDISKQGQDALLKQVEQCPEHLIYIFCTTEPDEMKNTLRKRCIEFQVSKVGADLVSSRLKFICDTEHLPYDESALYLIAERTNGHVRDAIKLLEETAYLGSINVDTLNTISRNYDAEIVEVVCSIGNNLNEAIEKARIVSDAITPRGLYNGIIGMLTDTAKMLYGYDNYLPQKRRLLERIRDIQGLSILEVLSYLVQRDKFIDGSGLVSDIVLLHYKMSSNSFQPQAPQVQPKNAPTETAVTQKETASENSPSSSALTHAELSKLSISERMRVLREMRKKQNPVQNPEELESVPSEWPLLKDESLGEGSFDDEELSPSDFSQLLVGGRSG